MDNLSEEPRIEETEGETAEAEGPVILETGQVVEGVVTGITNFGAFVELPGGKSGLIHISEISDSYVEDIRQHLQESDRVKVRILRVNPQGKFDLSIRQVDSAGQRKFKRTGKGPGGGRAESKGPASFEDKITRFLKESEERQLDIKRNREAKRGRGRGR